MKISEIWFKVSDAKTPEDKERVKQDFALADRAFTKLNTILTDMVREHKEKDYNNPNWAFFEADRNGYNRAIREVINLIEYKEKG